MSGGVLLEADGLARHYASKGPWGAERKTAAVEDVSLRVLRGETLALVGESGCGKSTTARLLLGLEPPTAGTIRYRGLDLASMSRGELLEFRRRVQLVFQDPFASLNPRMTVGGMLGEVLSVHALAAGIERERRITELLGLVGLGPDAAERYPHEFSGGQRQRIGIARALAVEPELIGHGRVQGHACRCYTDQVSNTVRRDLKLLNQETKHGSAKCGHFNSAARHRALQLTSLLKPLRQRLDAMIS